MAKATRQPVPPAFSPVVLTLDSQAEVDSIYAALNHSIVAEAIRGVAKADTPAGIRTALQDHKSAIAGLMHSAIHHAIYPQI